MYLVGKGAILNASTGVEFPQYAELSLSFEPKTTAIPLGDRNGSDYVVTDQVVSGRLAWEQVDVLLLSAVLGSASGVGGVRRMRLEEALIPDSTGPYTISLSQENNLSLTEVVRDSDGRRFFRTNEEPDINQYAIAGKVLTFSPVDAGKRIFIDYYYQTTTGQHIVINPNDLPGSFKLVGCVHLAPATPDENEGDMVVIANRCVRTSAVSLGGKPGEVSSLSFDFAVVNRNSGDLSIYFP
jgi:hypothetical protein